MYSEQTFARDGKEQRAEKPFAAYDSQLEFNECKCECECEPEPECECECEPECECECECKCECDGVHSDPLLIKALALAAMS